MEDTRIHFAPRSAALNEEPPDVLVPALTKLRACTTPFDVLLLIETLPDAILPALTWAASRKGFIPHVAVKTLVKACGQAFLQGQLGKFRAHELMARYSA
jgi:hypothetical protein